MIRQLVAAAAILVASAPTFAADEATAAVNLSTQAATRASLDAAIEHQESLRSGAIAGFVVGAVPIVVGAVYGDVAASENQDEKSSGKPTTHNEYVGLVGLAVGLPIMGVSALVFADSQKKLNGLRHERLRLGYSQDTGQPMLSLAADF